MPKSYNELDFNTTLYFEILEFYEKHLDKDNRDAVSMHECFSEMLYDEMYYDEKGNEYPNGDSPDGKSYIENYNKNKNELKDK